MKFSSDTKQLDFVGSTEITESCIQAILRYLHFGDQIQSAKLLSDPHNRHAFLLFLSNYHLVITRSGFTSGYNGEGPAGLAYILLLLKSFNIDTNELKISKKTMDKLNNSKLSPADIQSIYESNGGYIGIEDYIYFSRNRDMKKEQTWSRFPVTTPYKMIDARMHDLILEYHDNPDSSLSSGFRRLEDILKVRTETSLFGAKLCEHAFLGENSKLTWNVDLAEKNSRANYFKSTFSLYRNRRAHNEIGRNNVNDMTELLALNSLFLLEKEATLNNSSFGTRSAGDQK